MSGCSRLPICMRSTTIHEVSPYALNVTSVSNIDETADIQISRCYRDLGSCGCCCGVSAAEPFDCCAIECGSAHREDWRGAAFTANRLADRDAIGPIAGCHSPSPDPNDAGIDGAAAGRRWHRPVGPDQPGSGFGRPARTPMERVPRCDRHPERGPNGRAGVHLTYHRANAGPRLPPWFAGG